LGARAGGLALPFLRAFEAGGEPAVEAALQAIIEELRIVMLLSGCADIDALSRAPRVLGPQLSRWCQQLSLPMSPKPGQGLSRQ
jgi:isopentenyl diphosphate isomerase/L-lactate dehydrogenase-like FMN-dependent dehydrogenase